MSQHVQYGYYSPYPSGRQPQHVPVQGQRMTVPQQPQGPQQMQGPERVQYPQQTQEQLGPPPSGAPGQPPGGGGMEAPGAGSPAQFAQGPPPGGPPGPGSPVASPQPAPPQEQGEPVDGVAKPLVDIVETPDELIIIADVPGFQEEGISLRADDSSLLLVATREDGGDDEYRIISAERPRRLERVVPLPPNGDVDAASATYNDGVCTITIPKDGTDRREIGFH